MWLNQEVPKAIRLTQQKLDGSLLMKSHKISAEMSVQYPFTPWGSFSKIDYLTREHNVLPFLIGTFFALKKTGSPPKLPAII